MRMVLIAALLVAPALSGCAKYTLVEARATRVPTTAVVGLSVWAPEALGSGPAILEGYLTAALVDRGFIVRPLSLEVLAGRSLLRRALPQKPYSARRALAQGLAAGGELEGDDALIAQTLNANELDDARERLAGMVKVAAAVRSEWKLDVMLVVHRFDTFGYAVYVVDLAKERVIQMVVVSGTRKGFQKALGEPQKGISELAEDGDVSRMDLLRLADNIARKL